jgi:hypothetical protein
MSALDMVGDTLHRGREAVAAVLPGRLRRRPYDPASAAVVAEPDPGVGPVELYERRDQLARRLAELQWDLGGLTYEMAIRDHFRVDVLVRVAARLQAVDGELSEIERLLHLAQAGAGGSCPSCGALHARGAGFCWQCGTTLLPAQPSSVA